MSISKTETYYLHSRYANSYNIQTKTFTFQLNEPILNAVSLKLKQFYLKFIDNDLFEGVYDNNGYRTYDVSTNKINLLYPSVSKKFNSSDISLNDFSDNKIKLFNISEHNNVVFTNKNNDISKALGYRNYSYVLNKTEPKEIIAEGYIAKSLYENKKIKDDILKCVNLNNEKAVYDDMYNIYISLNDYCHTLNPKQIHMNTNDVSKYIIDKAQSTTDISNNVIKYTLDENSERNTRYYDKVSNLRSLQVQLLHETGTPLNLDNHEFNFTIEVEFL